MTGNLLALAESDSDVGTGRAARFRFERLTVLMPSPFFFGLNLLFSPRVFYGFSMFIFSPGLSMHLLVFP